MKNAHLHEIPQIYFSHNFLAPSIILSFPIISVLFFHRFLSFASGQLHHTVTYVKILIIYSVSTRWRKYSNVSSGVGIGYTGNGDHNASECGWAI